MNAITQIDKAEKTILFETANFWVRDAGERGFEVYETGLTHSTRVASIGHNRPGCTNLGLERAKQECHRREELRRERLAQQAAKLPRKRR